YNGENFNLEMRNFKVYHPTEESPSKQYSRKLPVCIEEIGNNTDNPNTYYYFFFKDMRTKYEWFFLLDNASKGLDSNYGMEKLMQHLENHNEIIFASSKIEHQYRNMIDYIKFLSQAVNPKYLKKPKGSFLDLDGAGVSLPPLMSSCSFFFNIAINRFFWEMTHQHFFKDFFMQKIQRIIEKTIDGLQDLLTDMKLNSLDFSDCPIVCKGVRQPFIDNKGLWLTFDISYKGEISVGISFTAELKKFIDQGKPASNTKSISDLPTSEIIQDQTSTHLSSKSGNEEISESSKPESKIIRSAERIQKNFLVQKFANFKPIKRIIENVSLTEISVVVTLLSINGTAAVNIPPPQTDLLWYALTPKTELDLKFEWFYGDKKHSSTISDKIKSIVENKLKEAIRKTIMLPNMDCIVINLDLLKKKKF
ncbi:MAG: Tabersonine 6,7-epoxidase isoform 2, partial [Paramarteilia canceri]